MFDVDDPFDQLHGPDAVNNPGANPASVIANVNLIDNDLVGCVGSICDNRGTTTGLGNSSAVTDANGEARITITVSMQPGDNYRAAASVISEAVQTQIDQTDADALSVQQVTVSTDPVVMEYRANGGFIPSEALRFFVLPS